MRMFVRRPSSRSVVAVQLSSVAAPSLGLKVSFAGSLSRCRRADAPFTGWVARHVGRLSAAVVELTDHGLLVAVVQRNGSSDPARSLRRRTARWFVSATRMAVAR
jgi:hypothetical protein